MMQNSTDNNGRTYEYVAGDPFQTRIYTLSNGLKVYLSKNDRKPEVQVLVGVRVGSNEDPKEATGMAHYLEHLMFKGTDMIGTLDYEKEKPILDEIESLYEDYGAEPDSDKRNEIFRRIDSLSNEASKYAIAQECWKLFESIGGTSMNAATGNYRTFYECVIPSNEIRRWAIIESERFLRPVFRGFHTELETIYEEYNMKNTDDGVMPPSVIIELGRTLYCDIPYSDHIVLGKAEHLRRPSLRILKEFYETYYCANNMAVVLSGDLDYEGTMDIIEEQFGRLRKNDNLPERKRYTAQGLSSPLSSTIKDPGQERMYLAWKIPGYVRQSESELTDFISLSMSFSLLQNAGCGLLEDLVYKHHKASSAIISHIPNADCSTMFITAQPVDGQSFDELKDILLKVVGQLKSGDFEDWRLKAAVNHFGKQYMDTMDDNSVRARTILDSFCNELHYDWSVSWFDRYSRVTKDDVVNAVNKYFTDGYIYICKQVGEADVPKIDKLEITPIMLNSESVSDYAKEFLAMEPSPIEPKFLDFSKDLSISRLSTGQKLVYCHNDQNDIFTLSFRSGLGILEDKWLKILDDCLDQTGTSELSSDERKKRLYELASSIDLSIMLRSSKLNISGLQSHFKETLDVTSDLFLNALPDDGVLKETTKAIATERAIQKDNPMECQKALFQYALNGGRSYVERKVIPDALLDTFTGREMVEHLHRLVVSFDTVTYHGPATEDEVRQILEHSSLICAFDGRSHEYETMACVVDEPEVLLLDIAAPSAFVANMTGNGKTMSIDDEASCALLNSYLNVVAYQEVRESRSLAYFVNARHSTPAYRGDGIDYSTMAVTQNIKVRDYIDTIEDMSRRLPLYESVFMRVKDQLLASLRTRRRHGNDVISDYMSATRKGYDQDPSERIYRGIQNLTLKDIEAYHRSRLGDGTFRYVVVGKISEMDMDYLKSKGKVTVLSKEDVFGY